MYDIAKKGREALKSKARRIAAGDNAKVDSSDWSPAPLINADKKTGARPVSPRLYKDGGKVSGDSSKPRADRPGRATGGATKIADAYVARNARKALGTAHVGAFKDGGVANKAALGAVDPKPHRAAAQHYKRGGKAEGGSKSFGSKVKDVIDRVTNYASPEDQYKRQYGDVGKSGTARYTESDKAALGKMLEGRKAGGRTGKAGGGSWLNKLVGGPKPTSDISQVGKGTTSSYSAEDKARLAERLRGEEPTGSAEEAAETSGRTGDKRGGRNWIKGAIKKPGALRKSLGVKEGQKIPAKKLEAAAEKGGKLGQRARLAQTLKRMGKKTGGGVNLTVVVSDKDKQVAPRGGMPMPSMPPMGPAMAPPPPMPPAPPPPGLMGAAGAPPAGLGPMARKAGGRISKVASSYKDMEAGAGSGEGRLQKTDIASKHKNAPARKSGGKVYKSYKDMDAGAGSGEGRLEKTEIEARKMARRA